MVSLADLPEDRREALLWRYALQLDYAGVEDLVIAGVDEPCRWQWWGDLTGMVAVLGDDGRYHLRDGPEWLCGTQLGQQSSAAGAVSHGLDCYWWTAGTGYHVHPPAGHPDSMVGVGVRYHTARWLVRLTDSVVVPESVPNGQRCPTNPGPWPAFHNPDTARGRLRTWLAAELGPHCHACRQAPAYAIDHDHVTGLVRGMLCRNCNSAIDRCVHIAGCPWADYLNNPPAAHLQLTFPNRGKKRSLVDLARAEYLGFDLFPR